MQVQKQIDELLALRASEWLELLPDASEEQLHEFAQWLGESRLHVQEFLEIAEIEYGLKSLDSQRRLDVDSVLKRIAPQVTALPARPAAGPFPSPQFSSSAKRLSESNRSKLGGFAAAACMLVALGTVLQFGYR